MRGTVGIAGGTGVAGPRLAADSREYTQSLFVKMSIFIVSVDAVDNDCCTV